MRNAVFAAVLLIFAATAATAAAQDKPTLIIKTDVDCQLSINGEAHGVLKANAAKSLDLALGRQLISCTSDDRRVERIEHVKAGSSVTVQLVLAAKERFERVADGIKDYAQKVIWAQADNGANIGWDAAKQYCAGMGKGWKLASGENLLSLYDASGKLELALDFNGTPYALKPATRLIKFSGGGYWSDAQNEYGVWGVNLATGARYTFTFDAINFTRALCVWPA